MIKLAILIALLLGTVAPLSAAVKSQSDPNVSGGILIPNNTRYAAGYPGPTWDVKVAAAALDACPDTGTNDVPMRNGVIDAQGLTGYQSIAATVTLPPNCTLLIGSGVFTEAGGAQILYDSGDRILGTGLGAFLSRKTQIAVTSGGTQPSMFAYVGGTGGPGAYGVEIGQMQVYGNGSASGLIALDLRHTLNSNFHDLNISSPSSGGIGLVLGFVGGCDCYNNFRDVFVTGNSYGVKIINGGYANANQWFGGGMGSPGVALYAGGQVNTFYSPDFENSGTSIEFPDGGSANTIYSSYTEANSVTLKLDAGTTGNMVWGGGVLGSVVNQSGNKSNLIFTTGTAATNGGNSPALWAADAFRLGGNLWGGSAAGADLSLVGGVDGGAQLVWSNSAIYGRIGGFPLSVGTLTANMASLNGAAITALPDPPAPTISQVAPGSVAASYYIVCKTPKGGVSLPSPAGSTTTGNSDLASNPTKIVAACGPGYNGVDLLKGGVSGTVLLTNTQLSPNVVGFNDTGQALSSYVQPARNTTGDMTFGAGAHIGCADGSPMTLSGGSLVCP